MSNYDDFLTEKLKIDDLIKKGYTITRTQGTLDGDVVEFENQNDTTQKETILLRNPDSRKYFTALYIKHCQKVAE